ncbi:5-methylcytosine restriction system specificity protein McrC [Neobacillus vireti]|uniref:5-methylcytosine restriction system specificity protein McrC n=1 Tax=Neobacillus vireti TaxID=220686 RepID=UPI002FFD712D
MRRVENKIYYGKTGIRIALSPMDEIVLKETLDDRERWTRITPNGKEKFEPLFENIERIDSKHCIVTPGPYVGKIKLLDSDLLFLPPTWLKGFDTSHLMYMMIKSMRDEPKAAYLPEFVTENRSSVSELNEPLYSFFVNEAFKALKKGIYRNYEHQKIISPRLRGKLDFSRQISLNIRGKALFATEQQVFSEDNDVNQLLFLANKVVLEQSNSYKTIETAQQVKRILPNLSNTKSFKAKKINLPRRGNHFKSSIELAKLIVSGQSISYEGELANTFSMVINLFDLFEKYVSSELFSRDTNYNNQYPLLLTDSNAASIPWSNRTVYPDIVYSSSTKKMVIDMKLKRISNFGPQIEDIYQIFFYSTMINLKSGILIYPTNSDTEQIYKFPLSHAGADKLQIIAYGLPIVKPVEKLSIEIDKLHSFLLKTP